MAKAFAAAAGWLVLCLMVMVAPALAQQVLYCVDTQAVGFVWDKTGQVRQVPFKEDRFTVNVLSDTHRSITRTTGDSAGWKKLYACKASWPEGRIVCDDGEGDVPWVFYRNTYTRAFLAGPPAGGIDQNIWMAYGTCTRF